MPNHPYPQPKPFRPAYSCNEEICQVCGKRWTFYHPANGFAIIHRICPMCIPQFGSLMPPEHATRRPA